MKRARWVAAACVAALLVAASSWSTLTAGWRRQELEEVLANSGYVVWDWSARRAVRGLSPEHIQAFTPDPNRTGLVGALVLHWTASAREADWAEYTDKSQFAFHNDSGEMTWSHMECGPGGSIFVAEEGSFRGVVYAKRRPFNGLVTITVQGDEQQVDARAVCELGKRFNGAIGLF